MRPLVTCLTVGPGFLVLGSILPVVIGPWVSLSCEHHRDREEEERFIENCLAGSPRLLLCILEHINILGDTLYLEVIALHLIMQLQEVKGMENCAPHLEVGEKRLWHDVGIKCLHFSEFPHPRIINDGEDELRSLSPRCLC